MELRSGVERGREVLVAGCLAGLLGGVPSTLHALLTGRDPLAATRAAGSLVGGPDRLLLGVGTVVHAVVSVGWAAALLPVLHHVREPVTAGALLGAGIAAVDLRIAQYRFPSVAALPRWPQVADHVVYGACLGLVVDRSGQRLRCAISRRTNVAASSSWETSIHSSGV